MKLLALTIAILSAAPIMGSQYFGLDVGTNHAEMTNISGEGPKIGLKLGARYGYVFDSGIRAEFHAVYRHNDHKTDYQYARNVESKVHSSMHSWSYMVNALYDVKQLTMMAITPYFGAGVGYCQNTAKHKVQAGDGVTTGEKYKDNRFAYQGIIGAKYAINDQLSTGLEYHYFCGKSHAKEHSFGVALIRNF